MRLKKTAKVFSRVELRFMGWILQGYPAREGKIKMEI